ncbi:hypothetical protein Leryth_024535 [Lithospermum erythrorhizon]|nr:hypothetical protein Leryth_024535 [Lithospermum erythrorhizon]
MSLSVKVAVIGAGLSGLVAARELQREGHNNIVVYEKSSRLGGLWLYDPRTESDPLSIDPNRQIVHSSLYFSLRTNLPREVMSFSDYPFVVREHGDGRNFPRHEEVLKFLENFAEDFGLVELIRFNEEVEKVKQNDGEWVVESRNGDVCSKEKFEAVVVCNGHSTEPCLAELPGSEMWTGTQIHSHNYRKPEPFEGQVVVIVGAGPSAIDISREVATVAKEVHLSSRSPNVNVAKLVGYSNIWQHSKVECLKEDGEISFDDGFSVYVDTIIHCTGYKYDFPFLETNGIVSVADNRVGPLYKHVFPPQLAPTLSFLAIPVRGIGFQSVELQSKWIASVLSGKVKLPSSEEMLADTEQYYKEMKEMEIPKHHTHYLDPFKKRNLWKQN